MTNQQTTNSYKYLPRFGFPVSKWNKVFIWLPKDTVDQGIKWLCFVYRRRIQLKEYLSGGPNQWWQYVTEKPNE